MPWKVTRPGNKRPGDNRFGATSPAPATVRKPGAERPIVIAPTTTPDPAPPATVHGADASTSAAAVNAKAGV